jgi:hypothetical protein
MTTRESNRDSITRVNGESQNRKGDRIGDEYSGEYSGAYSDDMSDGNCHGF